MRANVVTSNLRPETLYINAIRASVEVEGTATSITNERTNDGSMASKVEAQVEVKSPLDKFWDALRSSTELFPKVFPEQYKSIEVVEGDGKGVGTVRLLKYADGVPLVTFAKEKVEEADDANKMVAYSVIDGELLSLYKTFKIALKMAPKDEGSLVQWSLEYDKASDEVPEPDLIKETAVKTFNDLDAYLIKN